MAEAIARQRMISIIGAGDARRELWEQARQAGRLIARQGLGVVTGGLKGVMEAAAMGAAQEGGLTVGILPTGGFAAANPWCRVVIPSGLGQARNVLVVLAGDGVLAIGGGPGTLSELGHALKLGKPAVGFKTWELPGLVQGSSIEEAVERLMAMLPA